MCRFCYVNDLVLAIQELLKHHARVLYVDIDIHHGDGVEEAFYLTDRVMTVSFHKYGDFFPGTGAIKDMGELAGRGYSVNVPLKDGCDDKTFHQLFQPIMSKVMEVYRPGAVVLQCGADSLASDRLGCFNLTLQGHADAVKFMKGFNVPMLVTGGGGYIKHNVARCWALETATLLDKQVEEQIPQNIYYDYYAPEFKLQIPPGRTIENANTKQDIERIRTTVLEQLRHIEHAPGVHMHELPPTCYIPEYDIEDGEPDHPDARLTQYAREHGVYRDYELLDDDTVTHAE